MKKWFALFLTFLFVAWLSMGCNPKAQRFCETNTSCQLTYKPTVCFQTECKPKVCDPGQHQTCYTGEPSTQGKGACRAGVQVCTNNGSAWSSCFGQVLPIKEICDSHDNNCNGKVDEDLTCSCAIGENRPCQTSPSSTSYSSQTTCRKGVQYCTQTKTWGVCQKEVLPHHRLRIGLSQPQTVSQSSLQQLQDCQNRDVDCDGLLDNNMQCDCKQGDTRPCYVGPDGSQGRGLCKPGTQECVKTLKDEWRWGFCEGQQLPRPEEALDCNQQDDDCDGLIDNQAGTIAPLWRRCPTPQDSACSTQICVGGMWRGCKVRELCGNQQDDDCDGKIDEDEDSNACCQSSEICNNKKDDNCDGQIDESTCQPATVAR